MWSYNLLLLAYTWLVLGTTWNWVQDGFNTVKERSELRFQESMGSLRELSSTAPRIYSGFGTLDQKDGTIKGTIDGASDGINYEIGLGDSSSHVGGSSSDEMVEVALPEPEPPYPSTGRLVVFGYGHGQETVMKIAPQSDFDIRFDEDRSCETRGWCWPFSC